MIKSKALSSYLHKYPFIRFLTPLIIGIFFCDSFLYDSGYTGIAVWSLSVVALFLFILYYFRKRHADRWLFGTVVYLLFFLMGVGVTAFRLSTVHCHWSKDKTAYEAVLTETPQEKAKSFLCAAKVLIQCDTIENSRVDKSVLLYLAKDSLSENLNYGDKLLLYGRITQPVNNGNPEEFDYASYLLRKGVSGTAFVGSGDWKQTGHLPLNNIRWNAETYRQRVLDYYKNLGFKGDELAVLSALTLGYKEELSDEIKDSYSTSGISHLLALSGLHIGLIVLFLNFLFGWMDRLKTLAVVKQVGIIIFLWGYAYFAGLSPSVIRSVTMFSLIIFSGLCNMNRITLNTLAVAAFLMLLWNPFYLFDVSFQLSFVAVTSIVILQPFLVKPIKVKSRLGKYLRGLLTVTVAAQIGTCPIVMYYFSSFPVYFLFANILAIPLVFIIMCASMLMLLLSVVPFLQMYVVKVVAFLLELLNEGTSFIEHLPYSSINHIWFTPLDVWTFYLILILLALYFVGKYRKAILCAGVSLLLLCIYHTYHQLLNRDNSSIVFYNNRSYPAIHFVESRDVSFLVTTENKEIMEPLQRSYQRYWDSKQLKTPKLIIEDCSVSDFWKLDNIIYFRGKTVCVLADNRWRNKMVDKPLIIDYLYVCKGYKGRLAEIATLFKTKKVLLDSSLNTYRLAELKEECTLLGWDFISILEKGSLYIDL